MRNEQSSSLFVGHFRNRQIGTVRWERFARSSLRQSDSFLHPHCRSGSEPGQDDSLWHSGVPRDPSRWIVGASTLPAVPELLLWEPGVHHRPARYPPPPGGGGHPGSPRGSRGATSSTSQAIRLRRHWTLCRRIKKRSPSWPTRAVLRLIVLTMASNPAAEDVDLVL